VSCRWPLGLADAGAQLSPLRSLEKAEVGAEVVGFLASERPIGSRDSTYRSVEG
jgi:hypothetical protein